VDIGPPELILILVVVLVLFGGAQLPKLARNLGKAQQEFKKGLEGARAGDDEAAATEVAHGEASSDVPTDAKTVATSDATTDD